MITIFTTYLIYPIIAIILGLVMVLIARKNKLLGNKRLIAYAIMSVLLLSAPALLGFLDYKFMPYAYLAISIVCIILSLINEKLLFWAFKKEVSFSIRIVFIVFQCITGMLLFALVFNLCNELKYGFWASTCLLPFLLTSLLLRCYHLVLRIPVSIYKIWQYESAASYATPDELDHNVLKVVVLELFKKESDRVYTAINAKIPDEMIFGEWVKLLFDDYNKKTADSPIEVSGSEYEGWLFYMKPNFISPRKYIDFEQTVKENKIKSQSRIIARRVKEITETH